MKHHLDDKVWIVFLGREIRLPLRIKGEGMGPKIHFNFELLDIGKVFVGSVHCYEVNIRIVHWDSKVCAVFVWFYVFLLIGNFCHHIFLLLHLFGPQMIKLLFIIPVLLKEAIFSIPFSPSNFMKGIKFIILLILSASFYELQRGTP